MSCGLLSLREEVPHRKKQSQHAYGNDLKIHRQRRRGGLVRTQCTLLGVPLSWGRCPDNCPDGVTYEDPGSAFRLFAKLPNRDFALSCVKCGKFLRRLTAGV